MDKASDYPSWGDPPKTAADLMGPKGMFQMAMNRPAFPENYEIERDTTSFSIVDQYGNAVACTPTLGGGFGNGVVVGNTGLLLNNGVRLGSSSPYPDNVNYVQGGKIPILNNSPSIVLKNGSPAFVYGTPGGETIGQTEFEMLVNLIDFHMPIQQAVEFPRFAIDAKPNFYKPGAAMTITIENRVAKDQLAKLQAMGHHLNVTSDFTGAVGGMQGIAIDQAKGTMVAGADPRRTGYAVGW
jgi:gamma-glutamyltranspeptidase/glutathione hydrolase